MTACNWLICLISHLVWSDPSPPEELDLAEDKNWVWFVHHCPTSMQHSAWNTLGCHMMLIE
jgi:hypothetical protein